MKGIWGWGLGDGELGIGDWAQSPIPNPQSPNPQSPSSELVNKEEVLNLIKEQQGVMNKINIIKSLNSKYINQNE